MKTINNEHITFFDCDDTLVMHREHVTKNIVSIFCPIEKKFLILEKNTAMIRLLKEEKARGSHVIVWSRGGFAWAESVVKALGLEGHVHQVMTKPLVYFDDKDIREWLPHRIYLGPETNYKN